MQMRSLELRVVFGDGFVADFPSWISPPENISQEHADNFSKSQYFLVKLFCPGALYPIEDLKGFSVSDTNYVSR